MQTSNRRIFDSLVSRTKIYLVLIFLLLVIICILKPIMIAPSIVLFFAIVAYTYFANNKRKSEISQHLQDLTLNVNAAAKTSLIHSPFPLIILETDGNIIWRSTRYVSEFANEDMSMYIGELLEKINKKIEEKSEDKDKNIKESIKIGNNDYKVLGEFVKSGTINRKKQSDKYMIILYFIDETEVNKLQKEYEDSKNCVGVILIDNYEETMLQIDSEERPQLLAEIEKSIYEWANRVDGIIIKSDRDRFVYVFDHKYLDKIKEDKFSILDTIKDITINKVQVTLSIAISNDGETNKEKYKTAVAAMDVILGRGGDQATIRENEKYQFFGGRTTEFEKRTKVKARIVAHALEELMKESEQIIIMGHKNPDIDAIGSALGLYRLAKKLEKEVHIVASTDGMALKELVQSLNEVEEYNEIIIGKELAENQITPETLLIVVDTNKTGYVEAPELLERTGKIAIIDHHRRSPDFIKDSILTFHEVYASSAAELVTEILQYTEAQPVLTSLEAEALYAGIMMDTKNFTFKTGVRTFEAAAYLRRYGIDIIKVKKWFQSDLETYRKIMNIIDKTEVLRDIIGISIYQNNEDKDAGIICAKAADELLTIGNITTSFVIGNVGEIVSISGRSIGEINVQLILEKMGGGGHGTVAGAQIEGKTINEVKEDLIQKINEYFEETEA